jgi:hypothetical protein
MGLANNGGVYIKNNAGTFGGAAVVDSVNQFILGSTSFSSTYMQCSQHIYFASGSANRAILDSSGRLGIGTLNPTNGIDVLWGDAGARTAQFTSTAGYGCYVTANTTTATNDSTFVLANGGTRKWFFSSVGTLSYRLYISDAETDNGVYMSQNTNAWTAMSDSRLKDVRGAITDALAKVSQLTGVRFTWKRDADNPDAKVRVGRKRWMMSHLTSSPMKRRARSAAGLVFAIRRLFPSWSTPSKS